MSSFPPPPDWSTISEAIEQRDAALADAKRLREVLRGLVREATSERGLDALFDYLIENVCERADELDIAAEEGS